MTRTRARRTGYAALVLTVACLLAGCKKSPPPAPTEDAGHHLGPLPPVGPTVRVTLDGKSIEVPLASLPHEGTKAALGDLWKAAWPAASPEALHFDLTGSDGFHPASRRPCERMLTGAEIGHARIDVVSHDVSFDGAVELPGCYRVKAVVAMDGLR